MGIFDEIDMQTNNNSSFWTKVNLSISDLTENILFQSLATIKSNLESYKTRYLLLTNSSLYFCGITRDIIKRKSIICWKTVRAFQEQKEKSEEDKRYIFEIGSNAKEEFFFYNSELFETWLDLLGKVAIMTDFESQFALVKKIGSGSFANVFQATELSSLNDYAVKFVLKEKILSGLRGNISIINEIKIMRQLDHPGIVKLYKVFENDEAILLLLDYLPGGSLNQRINAKKKMAEVKALKIISSLLNICTYLHKLNIVHRDFKPENILLSSIDNEDNIKLIDFGLTCYLSETHSVRCGSPGYIAPEILSNEVYNEKSDLFSIGIILYILICGHSPYSGTTAAEILKKNRLGEIYFFESEWRGISQECIDLILALTRANPDMRPSAEEALKHSWFNSRHHPGLFIANKQKIHFPLNSTEKKISSRLMERFNSLKKIERPEEKQEIRVDSTRANKVIGMLRKVENF